MEQAIKQLKAISDPIRLRILNLCHNTELAVSELEEILSISQPRLSRHLKILTDSKFLIRNQQGNWVFYRLSNYPKITSLTTEALTLISNDNSLIDMDQKKLKAIKDKRAKQSDQFFKTVAGSWEKIRNHYIDSDKIDHYIIDLFSQQKKSNHLDIGTGTGHILSILSPYIKTIYGVDKSKEMLNIARSTIDRKKIQNCHLSYEDCHDLSFDDHYFDSITIHMSLHYFSSPDKVITEACRVIKKNGLIVIVDFETHNVVDLAEKEAHQWLGFSDHDILSYFKDKKTSFNVTKIPSKSKINTKIWAIKLLEETL